MKELIAKLISESAKTKSAEILNSIEIPPSPEMGDFAFPCFVLAKELKKNPVHIAQELAGKIKSKDFERIEAKGPYLNFFLNRKSVAEDTLKEIQKEKAKFGGGRENGTVMIEFSQANTHKAFHVGHIRGTSFGESLARIFECMGNKVIRANYEGDTGMHVAKWIWCYQKYHLKEKLSKDESWIASIYVDAVKRLADDENLQEEVNLINQKLEEGKDKKLMKLWKQSRDYSLEAFEKIYKELNTHFNRYYFEREVEKRGKEIAQNLVKGGVAEISDGATIINFEKEGLGVWVLLRKDGTVLYSAKDLALAEKKFQEYKLTRAITATGAAQMLHTRQISRTLELMKFKHAKGYEFVQFSEVRLPTGKMSSRTGENILYSDFMKEMTSYAKSEIEKREKLSKAELEERALKISIAAIKYAMLKQHSNSVITFNKQEALNFEGNTGPYLLYSYARARSILKKAKYNQKSKYSAPKTSEHEKALIMGLGKFPEIVQNAYNNLAPNLIANYAYELSQIFNEFYHSEQVIGSENEQFRLVLVDSFSQVLKNALSLLGIETIEKM